jgi:tripartite-type tricarboxylate transporter receptor subunit TctC
MVAGGGLAGAQEYPTKPIRIVTSAPGGGNDFTARLIAQGLTDSSLGQPVIVDNRGGGVLPGQTVLQSPPDGYTLLVAGSSFMIGHLLEQSPFDPERDFTPVCLAATAPNILLVHPTVPAKSVKELIALAKAKPGQLNYSSSASGSTQHLSAELFKSMAGVDIVRVAYKGAGPGLIALIAGETQIMISTAPSSAPHIKSGKVRALAVTSSRPSALAPGLPTVAETGLPGYEVISVDTVFARAKTPPAIVNKLNQEIARVLTREDVRQKFFASGSEVAAGSAQELGALLRSEIAKWGKVIKEAGISK